LTAGVTLPPGGGSWSSLSDAAVKENVTQVDPTEILRGVASLPISTWNYESQAPSIRHIGPMAQDFNEAFNVGEDDRFVTTVDADGVALAAIQGLNAKIEALKDRLTRNGRTEKASSTPSIWQGVALLILAFGIGLAGRQAADISPGLVLHLTNTYKRERG
jgi:endosialidase-like protein